MAILIAFMRTDIFVASKIETDGRKLDTQAHTYFENDVFLYVHELCGALAIGPSDES